MSDTVAFEWRKVVFACETDEYGNCPNCEIDYADCPCPGPTMDGYEYEEREDGLYARLIIQDISGEVEDE